MATAPNANFPLLRLPRPHSRFSLPQTPPSTFLRRKLRPATIRAAVVGDGDFGARDPFPAEIESNFGDKAPMPEDEAQKLLKKVVGWRLVDNGRGQFKLRCLWKLRDFKCCVELINRISNAVDDANHFPDIHLDQPNQVTAELWTSAIGGLSMNDFIIAAKIDEIKTIDLAARKRAWA
ncbi:putative pterin-4-alpha-carbinolamine dehydratase, chloroplastic, partial [Cucurbita argyrosperma subsp. sororia]